MPSISDLQPYFAAIGAFLSVATFGFVVRIALLFREAERQRTVIIEERLTNVKEDLARTEKWSDREKQDLTSQNESLRSQLEEVLSGSGLTIETLATGKSLQEAQESIQQSVEALIQKMEAADKTIGGIGNPGWHLELAKGYMATRDWANAARHLDQYVASHPTDAGTQFSRGVAHANTLAGDAGNLAALRAYNEAIAFAPPGLEKNMLARYFVYRGAMLKRMNRLQEAESDLQLALPLASRDYEVYDIKYNLAAVYAMQGDRVRLLEIVNELRRRPRELAAIKSHLVDYFAKFAKDDEFLEIINPNGESAA